VRGRRHSRWRRGGRWCHCLCSRWYGESVWRRIREKAESYSRAQRYGSNARILGRAHVFKSNADFKEAILCGVGVEIWIGSMIMEGLNFFEVNPRSQQLYPYASSVY
jgi:hypothetical protein